MTYYSAHRQDEFVATILNFKKNGCFVEIGSNDAKQQSNSYFFESELKWRGICIDIDPVHIRTYDQRTCRFINKDATQIDYGYLFEEEKLPSRIDYLSIDTDDASDAIMPIIPFNKYRFSVLTVEHDAYRVGHRIRDIEREVLTTFGYILLFKDVLVPLGCGMGGDLPFEDWWIDPSVFNIERQVNNEKIYPDDIIEIVKNKLITYTPENP